VTQLEPSLSALVRTTAVVQVPMLSLVAAAWSAQAGWAQEVWFPAAERAAAFDRRLPES
jgi:hypothetical protein